MSDPSVAFTLRIRLNNLRPVIVPRRGTSLQERIAHEEAVRHNAKCALVTMTAYDDKWSMADTHGRIDVEVKHGRAVIFPRGQLYCKVAKMAGHSSDGMAAKELVMALVAMHTSAGGGEGDDYYADYTPTERGIPQRTNRSPAGAMGGA